jgi:hypothetical protein
VLESLLSPFLFAYPPGFLEGALEWLGGSIVRRRRLRDVLAALGRKHQDRATEVSRLVDGLPERDRRLLLDALPRILRQGATGTTPPPALHYSLPAAGETPAEPFLLAWNAPSPGGDVQDGDLLLVDPGAAPSPGDLVVLRGGDGMAVARRVEQGTGGYRLASLGGGPAEEPAMDEAGLRAILSREGVGIVVEVLRPLRPRGR